MAPVVMMGHVYAMKIIMEAIAQVTWDFFHFII